MMAAMMLPSSAPMVLVFRRLERGRSLDRPQWVHREHAFHLQA